MLQAAPSKSDKEKSDEETSKGEVLPGTRTINNPPLTIQKLPPIDLNAAAQRDRVLSVPSQFAQFGALQQNTPFALVPVVTISQGVTDNVRGTATNQTVDSFTNITLDFGLAANTRRLQLVATGSAAYSKFINATDLDGNLVNATGQADISLINGFLYLESRASVSDQFNSLTGTPATARPTPGNSSRVATYDVGPYLRTTVADLFDVLLRARYAEVTFPNQNIATPGLVNSSFNQLAGQIGTGSHIQPYQIVISGEYLKQNQGFESEDGVFSLFIGKPTGFQLVGRGGYEKTFQPGIVDLKGPIWSAGFIARPGRSVIQAEYGRRFGGPTWTANANIVLSPQFSIVGVYLRSLETEQSRLLRSLTDLFDQSGEFSIGTPPVLVAGGVNITLTSGTFINEDVTAGIVWSHGRTAITTVGDRPSGTQVTVTGGYRRQTALNAPIEQKSITSAINVEHALSRRMSITGSFEYDQVLRPFNGGAGGRIYRVRAGFDYSLNATVSAGVTYAWQKNIVGNGLEIPENVVQISINKRF